MPVLHHIDHFDKGYNKKRTNTKAAFRLKKMYSSSDPRFYSDVH